jgi:gliding-associated putative ABC transporter substrate-binding component GldG
MVRLETATNPPLPEQYNKSNLPVAVLLEGTFRSVFKDRMPEAFLRVYRDSLNLDFREQSDFTRMVVVADGDMIRNEVNREGRIAPLGAYRFNNSYLFANKEFFLNVVDYLTDNDGIIAARTKDFKVRPLDRVRLRETRWRWQAIVLGLPVVLLLLFAGVYHFIRTKKYVGKV